MKERLDLIVVKRGMVGTRERARALIMEGKVLVNNRPATKAGAMVDTTIAIELKGQGIPYVSRGGLKLEAAIEHFGIELADIVAMDVGSSTGGFTDCLLQKGARKVYCIDVGYGQLAWSIRNNSKVILIERTNIRYLEKTAIPEAIDFITIDLSFISLTKVLTKVMEFMKKGGEILALVKPQFEVGRAEVGKGGIIRDEQKRMAAVASVKEYAEQTGLQGIGVYQSPVPGQKGNREYFLYLKNP